MEFATMGLLPPSPVSAHTQLALLNGRDDLTEALDNPSPAVWAVIGLVTLAGVGGLAYYFYSSQEEEVAEEEAPVEEEAAPNGRPKRKAKRPAGRSKKK